MIDIFCTFELLIDKLHQDRNKSYKSMPALILHLKIDGIIFIKYMMSVLKIFRFCLRLKYFCEEQLQEFVKQEELKKHCLIYGSDSKPVAHIRYLRVLIYN